MSLLYAPGSTGVSITVQFVDDTGKTVTGLVAATMPPIYWSTSRGATTQITPLADLSLVTSAHSAGGVKERTVGAYRLDLSDTMLADEADITLWADATDKRMIPVRIKVSATAKDVDTKLGTPAGGSVSAAVAAVKSDTAAILLDTGTDGVVVAAGSKTGYSLTAGTGLGNQTANITGTITTVTTLTNLPSIPTNWITSSAISDGAFTAAKFASASLNGKGDWNTTTPPAVGAIADAVWDEVLSGHLTAGSTGNALNAAGSAGDPWSTSLPGAYAAGTAGNIIGNRLDAAISSRMATFTYTTPLDAAGVRAAIGLATNNLDAQLGTITEKIGSTESLTDAIESVANHVDTLLTRVPAIIDVSDLNTFADRYLTLIELDGAGPAYRLTIAALVNAPAGEGGGGGGVTLSQLQTEMTAIKGVGWNGSTDTLKDIRDNMPGLALTSAVEITISGPSSVRFAITAGNSYLAASGTGINLTPPGFIRQGWPSSLSGWTVTLYARATPSTAASAGALATSFSTTLTVAGSAGAEQLALDAMAASVTTGIMPGDWTYQAVATNGSQARTLLSGSLSVRPKLP